MHWRWKCTSASNDGKSSSSLIFLISFSQPRHFSQSFTHSYIPSNEMAGKKTIDDEKYKEILVFFQEAIFLGTLFHGDFFSGTIFPRIFFPEMFFPRYLFSMNHFSRDFFPGNLLSGTIFPRTFFQRTIRLCRGKGDGKWALSSS